MYLTLKAVHVLAVVIFLGNITTGLFWHAHAWRTRDPRLLAHTVRGLIRSDRIFTVPSVLALIAAGVGAAIVGGFPMLRTGWILWTIVLFAISGAIFGMRIAPIQRQLLGIANASAEGGAFDETAYARLAAKWRAWGAIAVLAPVIGAALMVLKPF